MLKWKSPSIEEREDIVSIEVERTDDQEKISKINPDVLQTIYNSSAVRAATADDIDLATLLFTQAGNDEMLTAIKTYGPDVKDGNKEAGRTLRTLITTRAHDKNGHSEED